MTATLNWPHSNKSCLEVNKEGNITAFYNQSGEIMFRHNTSDRKDFTIEKHGVAPKVTGVRNQEGLTIIVYGSNDTWSYNIVDSGNEIFVISYDDTGKINQQCCLAKNIISYVNSHENMPHKIVVYIDNTRNVKHQLFNLWDF
jgi:hypothetical protein